MNKRRSADITINNNLDKRLKPLYGIEEKEKNNYLLKVGYLSLLVFPSLSLLECSDRMKSNYNEINLNSVYQNEQVQSANTSLSYGGLEKTFNKSS